jgi:hypothetical protein
MNTTDRIGLVTFSAITAKSIVQALAAAAVEIVSEWAFGVNAFRVLGNPCATLFDHLKNLAFGFTSGVV